MQGGRFAAPTKFPISMSFEEKGDYIYPLSEAFKTVSGYNYDGPTKTWDFPLSELERCVRLSSKVECQCKLFNLLNVWRR